MQRFFFVLILASSVLRAASFTSANCTVGNITQTVTGSTSANCSLPLFFPPAGEVGYVEGSATISGSLGNGLFAEGNGGFGVAIGFSGSGPDVYGSGFGSASYSQTFTTAGPKRPGFVSCIDNGFGGSWIAGVTQHGFDLCVTSGPSPLFSLELGEPFQVSLSADGGGGGTFPCYASFCAGDSSASITLYAITEADGITPVPYFAVVTPEPTTWGLFLFGLAGYIVVQACARRMNLKGPRPCTGCATPSGLIDGTCMALETGSMLPQS